MHGRRGGAEHGRACPAGCGPDGCTHAANIRNRGDRSADGPAVHRPGDDADRLTEQLNDGGSRAGRRRRIPAEGLRSASAGQRRSNGRRRRHGLARAGRRLLNCPFSWVPLGPVVLDLRVRKPTWFGACGKGVAGREPSGDAFRTNGWIVHPTKGHEMEKNSRASRYAVGAFAAAAAAALVLGSAAAASAATPEPSSTPSLAQAQAIVSNGSSGKKPVGIEVFAPERHSNAGIEGKGWFVDMEIDFPGGPGGLA